MEYIFRYKDGRIYGPDKYSSSSLIESIPQENGLLKLIFTDQRSQNGQFFAIILNHKEANAIISALLAGISQCKCRISIE
jgi:hypothetical protein